jgi:hypothetical protein
MTFIEAALKVLEHEGRPLHSREIAERAVEWGLLSHVGKTPVQTMSGCLSAAVAKGRGKTPFARVTPGVFGLAIWGGHPPGRRAGAPPRPAAKKAAPSAAVAEKIVDRAREEAAVGEPEAGEAPAPDGAEVTGKRRKRKRRRKRPDERPDPAGGADQRETPTAPPVPPARPDPRRPDTGPKPAKRQAASERKREPVSDDRPKPPSEAAPAAPAASAKRVTSPMADLADRAEELLRTTPKPIPLARLGEALGTPGGAAAALLDALLTADGIEREQRGMRPRFVEHRSGWALAEREVSAEIIALERQATEASERLSRLAERQVLRRLRALPQDVLARIVVIFLRRFGFGEMQAVDRGRGDELHLSVQDRRRGGRFRTAVVVRRDPADHPVTDTDVASLRGALHHYEAMSALVITTGTVDDRARAEAGVANLAPVALVDGDTLARELVQHGIGVRERRVSLPAFDESFFATLAE